MFAMSTDVTLLYKFVFQFNKLLLEFEFYVANTDKQSNTNRETSQCSYPKYNHSRSWNTARSIKLMERN